MEQNKTLVINQPRGLGDILFEMAIAREYIKQGYSVIFPILDIFLPIQKHFPDITFISSTNNPFNIDLKDKVEVGNFLFLPMRFADQNLNVTYTNCMLAKYKYLDIPMTKWRELTWVRDEVKENELIDRYLTKKGIKEFVFRNKRFDTTFNGFVDIKLNTKLPIIDLQYEEGYTLIDWLPLIQKAKEIHTVSTSISYLLDLIELEAKEVNVYKRGAEPHKHYDYLFSKHKYIYK